MKLVQRIDSALFAADIAVRAAAEWLQTGLVFDPTRPAMRSDPYPIYRKLREKDPFHRSWPAGGFVLTRYQDIVNVLADRRFSSDERNWNRYERLRKKNLRAGIPDFYDEDLASMLRIDPPHHTRLRTIVSKAFTPRAVERMRPRVQAVADQLIDGLRGRRQIELVRDFAAPLPVTIIAEMLGVPSSDHERFRHWSDEVVRSLGESTHDDFLRADVARKELEAYLGGEVEARRHEPREDLLSALVAAEEAGDRLSLRELFATCVLLLVAGNETTTNLISNGLVALLRHPDQLALLRDEPKRIPGAVEELLRYDSPVQLTSRLALEDCEVAGVRVRRREQLVLVLAAGNRDPARYTDPERLDVLREDVRPLSFGHGIHFCLGAQLARLEAHVAFEALLTRLHDIKLTDAPIAWGDNTVLRGPKALPLELA